MGSEMSCPCSNHNLGEDLPTPDEDAKIKQDILKEVMKGKLTKDKLLFEYATNNSTLFTKICLIATKNVEAFFQNRNLLIIQKKNEINLYYNTIFIANFLNKDDLTCIILQYKTGNEDRTNLYISPMNEMENPKKKMKQNDYSAVYKVENLNFISKEAERMRDQILNDLYSQLKKQYRFYGIITDSQEDPNDKNYSFIGDNKRQTTPASLNNSAFINPVPASIGKNYKVLYKKSKLTDNLDVRYSISVLYDNLNEENILRILTENKDKTLKSVFEETYFDSSRVNKRRTCYFFIFESNKITPEFDESEFLVVKMDKDRNTPDTFLKDIADKIVMQDGVELLSVINYYYGFFLIFKLDINEFESDFQD
ncbi:MAG: hypothetical protein MJ252_05240 [archaeon]|nr:hypothetical protein [archaeon]